jgi:hypothetical protein
MFGVTLTGRIDPAGNPVASFEQKFLYDTAHPAVTHDHNIHKPVS